MLESKKEKALIKRFFDEDKKLFLIQYIQYESKKTFSTTIVMNYDFNEPLLSYALEEEPFSEEEFAKIILIPKPKFFSCIDSLIDKKYVPTDSKGKPISFTPNIFVSQSIPDECFEYLYNKYAHTANIRKYNKERKSRIKSAK